MTVQLFNSIPWVPFPIDSSAVDRFERLVRRTMPSVRIKEIQPRNLWMCHANRLKRTVCTSFAYWCEIQSSVNSLKTMRKCDWNLRQTAVECSLPSRLYGRIHSCIQFLNVEHGSSQRLQAFEEFGPCLASLLSFFETSREGKEWIWCFFLRAPRSTSHPTNTLLLWQERHIKWVWLYLPRVQVAF